jgi:hypothetical protein
MLWWEEGFCQMLADSGRFVIRYDHRDTGRSITYEPGRPGYTGTIEHGEALAEDIPGARLLPLEGGGNGVDRADGSRWSARFSTAPARSLGIADDDRFQADNRRHRGLGMERRGYGLGRVLGWLRRPAREAVARAVAIVAGASVLDVGCGSGEFCKPAAGRGAR